MLNNNNKLPPDNTSLTFTQADEILKHIATKLEDDQKFAVTVIDSTGVSLASHYNDDESSSAANLKASKCLPDLAVALPLEVMHSKINVDVRQGFWAAHSTGLLIKSMRGKVLGAVGVAGPTSKEAMKCAEEAILSTAGLENTNLTLGA